MDRTALLKTEKKYELPILIVDRKGVIGNLLAKKLRNESLVVLVSKKNPEEMAKQRVYFLKGTQEKKIPDKLSNEIFDQMETFARYGFNRSHSAAYALVSFQTAYLKAHYPVEFMAALMNHEMDDSLSK